MDVTFTENALGRLRSRRILAEVITRPQIAHRNLSVLNQLALPDFALIDQVEIVIRLPLLENHCIPGWLQPLHSGHQMRQVCLIQAPKKVELLQKICVLWNFWISHSLILA